jgi:hypothetical protein
MEADERDALLAGWTAAVTTARDHAGARRVGSTG